MDFVTMCTEMGLCNLVPSGWHWVAPPVMFLTFALICGVPIAHILHRAGRSRWWVIVAVVPLLNLIGLWVFAFACWPKLDRSPI
jgi:hypothetical protein